MLSASIKKQHRDCEFTAVPMQCAARLPAPPSLLPSAPVMMQINISKLRCHAVITDPVGGDETAQTGVPKWSHGLMPL